MSDDLKKSIREIQDFPKEGILFYDVTTLLKDKSAFQKAIDSLAELVKDRQIDTVVSVESRGFIFGAALAYRLGAGFVPVRKKGKLPAQTIEASYCLEYGTDCLQMHQDALKPSSKVLIVDDLLATGGTASAVCRMVAQLKAEVTAIVFLIELCGLKGREKLRDFDVYSLLKY